MYVKIRVRLVHFQTLTAEEIFFILTSSTFSMMIPHFNQERSFRDILYHRYQIDNATRSLVNQVILLIHFLFIFAVDF